LPVHVFWRSRIFPLSVRCESMSCSHVLGASSATQKVAPLAVAQRLTDLFMQFPSAAVGGIQWRVLARKYEERHATRLDLSNLGHASSLAAANTLLWEVLRLVDTEDIDNPIVAIDDSVALTPHPGSMASWPSLYVALCDAVQSSGTVQLESEENGEGVRCLLLSQLKPLLQSRWHANFDENGLGFLSEEGSYVKMKKMKHLVQAVLRWRDQRVEWSRSRAAKMTGADKVLMPHLELVASKKHNDLMLRYVPCVVSRQADVLLESSQNALVPNSHSSMSSSTSSPRSGMEEELAFLRAENAKLRSRNEMLTHEQFDVSDMASETSSHEMFAPVTFLPESMVEVFDDPYEPPPQKLQWTSSSMSVASTGTGRSTPSHSWSHSSVATPASMTPVPSSDVAGCMTPTSGLGCALVPMWFSLVPSASGAFGDRSMIPTGIVQRFRSQIDASDSAPLVPPPRWDRK